MVEAKEGQDWRDGELHALPDHICLTLHLLPGEHEQKMLLLLLCYNANTHP